VTALIRKWGNSAAVRIPGAALAAAGMKVDDRVEIRHENGRIVVESAQPEPLTLESLLAEITPENCHEEAQLGPRMGGEAW
jgi:antitoxin MazE